MKHVLYFGYRPGNETSVTGAAIRFYDVMTEFIRNMFGDEVTMDKVEGFDDLPDRTYDLAIVDHPPMDERLADIVKMADGNPVILTRWRGFPKGVHQDPAFPNTYTANRSDLTKAIRKALGGA